MSLASKTYDAMGADAFLNYVKCLSVEEAEILVSDAEYVGGLDPWNPQEVYLALHITNSNVATYMETQGQRENFQSNRDWSIFIVGERELKAEHMEPGTIVALSTNRKLGVSVAVKLGEDAWEVSGVEYIFNDAEIDSEIKEHKSWEAQPKAYVDGEVTEL